MLWLGVKEPGSTQTTFCIYVAKVTVITCILFRLSSRLGRAALSPATRVQARFEALEKWIGKNRSVQEGLDIKMVAGLDKIGLIRKRWVG